MQQLGMRSRTFRLGPSDPQAARAGRRDSEGLGWIVRGALCASSRLRSGAQSSRPGQASTMTEKVSRKLLARMYAWIALCLVEAQHHNVRVETRACALRAESKNGITWNSP